MRRLPLLILACAGLVLSGCSQDQGRNVAQGAGLGLLSGAAVGGAAGALAGTALGAAFGYIATPGVDPNL